MRNPKRAIKHEVQFDYDSDDDKYAQYLLNKLNRYLVIRDTRNYTSIKKFAEDDIIRGDVIFVNDEYQFLYDDKKLIKIEFDTQKGINLPSEFQVINIDKYGFKFPINYWDGIIKDLHIKLPDNIISKIKSNYFIDFKYDSDDKKYENVGFASYFENDNEFKKYYVIVKDFLVAQKHKCHINPFDNINSSTVFHFIIHSIKT